MRNSNAEGIWFNIGYVSLDADGKPYQPILGTGRHLRKKPITIYKDISRAASYSPVQTATKVRMFVPIEAVDISS